MLVFGLCGKDKSDTPLQPYKLNYVHGAKEKKKKRFIYTQLQIIESWFLKMESNFRRRTIWGVLVRTPLCCNSEAVPCLDDPSSSNSY